MIVYISYVYECGYIWDYMVVWVHKYMWYDVLYYVRL